MILRTKEVLRTSHIDTAAEVKAICIISKHTEYILVRSHIDTTAEVKAIYIISKHTEYILTCTYAHVGAVLI